MRILTKLFILLVSFGFVACSDSDSYNADTAESNYKPSQHLRKVATVRTTNTIDGRDYSWEHKFSYDAQGRIKEINTVMRHYTPYEFDNIVRYHACNIVSKACYYYRGEKLEVDYSLSREHPEYPDWNKSENGTDYGRFNEQGHLTAFSTLDFVYSRTVLQNAYSDSGIGYTIVRDGSGNVTGYKAIQTSNDSLLVDKSSKYYYSRIKNNTNFDFSAYFGYWGVEQDILANRMPYYASYQLGAFAMLGSTSPYLPFGIFDEDSNEYIFGRWELDDRDSPVLFTDATGRRTEITYVE